MIALQHELSLLRFRSEHDAASQAELAHQLHRVKVELSGVLAHELFYSRAHDCWVEHTQWAVDRNLETFTGTGVETETILARLSAITRFEQPSLPHWP